MASSLSLLSEEQFLCPICLDTFTQPVTTPCGHNFCTSCLASYWNKEPVCRCPVCKETFEKRPNLKVNTFISELASQFVLLQATEDHIWSSAVLCDICTDTQRKAIKSCLECLTSYCSVHLEPHHRAAGLKRHTLVEPLASLKDKICKEHSHLLALFCRNENILLCNICAGSQHVNHDVVPVHRAYKEKKYRLGNTEEKVQQMIHERQQKVLAMKKSVVESRRETQDVVTSSTLGLSGLMSKIQKTQLELVKVIKEKQNAAEEKMDGFIGCVEQELAELQRTAMKLRELRQTEDQHCFLQNFPGLSLHPHSMNSIFSLNKHLEIRHLQKSLSSSMSHMWMSLDKINVEINKLSLSSDATLRHLQQYEVNVLLDRDTAHPLLILSDDRKQVRYSMGSGLWATQNLNVNMFTEHLAVLGDRGFSSCKFYFEVFVSQKSEWCVGVAMASVQRRGVLARNPHSGLWAIWFLEDKFETFSSPGITVCLGKVERVGVFVDYDGGQISFYDVQSATLIYTFTECFFTEELCPYLNPCDNEYGSNLDPLVIVPVSRVV